MFRFVIFFSILFPLSQLVNASDSSASKAIALLKGVELARSKYDCFCIRYEEHRTEEGKTVEQFVIFDKGKIYKEHLPNKHFHGMKSILCDNLVYSMTSYEEKNLRIVMPNSIHAVGADIYDPRMLGLEDLMGIGQTISTCLLYTNRDKNCFSVSTEKLNGHSMYVVEYQDDERNGFAHWKYYIKGPEFQVIKIVMEAQYGRIQIDNEYSNIKLFPFPTTTHILRTGRKGDKETIIFDRYITVKDVEFKESFPPETFTMAALNLPLNSDVIDYRIQRRLGYWDGEKLVDDPVAISAQEHREVMKQMEEDAAKRKWLSIGGLIGIGIGAVLVLCAIYLMIREKRKP